MNAFYNRLLISALALFSAVVLGLAAFVEPLDGDLTRTGGYLESRFGWHGKQHRHDESFLFDMAGSLDDLNRPFDVLVIGDSFTRRAGFSWASYLVEMTGWNVIGFHHNDLKLQQLLDSEQFERFRPRVVVFQSVERRATRRFASLEGLHGSDKALSLSARDLGVQLPWQAPSQMVSRQTEFEDLDARMSTAVHYLRVWGREAMLGERHARVMPLTNMSEPVFTNEDHGNILLLEDDFVLRARAGLELPAAIEGLRNASAILRNQEILFIPLVFPDKLTVYADYLEDAQWRDSSAIPALAEAIPMPRLDLAYRSLVAEGMKDVYSPNNTHTSSAGSRVAAVEFLRFLSQQQPSNAEVSSAHRNFGR